MGKWKKRLLITFLVVMGGCGAGAIALMPARGPSLLSVLPPGDIVAKADDVDSLWAKLESSDKFAEFLKSDACEVLLETELGRELGNALSDLVATGIVTRWRASHIVGQEAGASVSFSRRGAVSQWVAAFRIDTLARAVELTAGRLFLGANIERKEAGGNIIASFANGRTKVWWTRLGDLLVVASSEELLTKSIASANAEGTESYGSHFGERFDLAEAPEIADKFRLAVRINKPEEKLAAALRLSARDRADMNSNLRAVGLPAPVDAVSLSMQLKDGEIIEDGFIRGAVGVPGSGDSVPSRRPAGTFFWWQFRPGREEAVARAWQVMRYLRPPRDDPHLAGWNTFRGQLQARFGPEVGLCLAHQPDIESPMGGFPAEFIFFRVVGAESLREVVEQLLRERSLGVFDRNGAEPVTYPYLVRHREHDAWIYEMVIRNTRRHDGYQPALAISGSNLVYCSSLPALERYLAGEGETRSPRGRAWVESLEGARVLALDWQSPDDLSSLKNAYDYVTELRRFAPPATAELLTNQVDYGALWRAVEDVVGQIELQQRLGVRTEAGMRMRARWLLAD